MFNSKYFYMYVIFLDNLSSHLSKEAMVSIYKLKFVLLYNSPYASEMVSIYNYFIEITSNFCRIQ